jgi:hypothetical protein
MSEISFIINDDNNIDDTQKINTDFYTAIVYLNQFKKTQMNGGYIHIPYFMPSGTLRPNLKYTVGVNTKRYKCINLYIFKKSHNITMDSEFDGELVIELIPTTNSADKLFMVYLLKNTRKSTDEYSELDKLIQISLKPPTHYDVMNFTLKDILEENHKRIVYKSGIDTVIINTNPIKIYEMDLTIYNTIPETLFSLYPVGGNYKVIKPLTKEGFTDTIIEGDTDAMEGGEFQIEGATNQTTESTMTCVPIDVGGEGGEETATLMVNGTFNEIVGKTAIASFVMLTISSLILAYFGSPWIFENLIYKKVSNDIGLTGATIFLLIVAVSLGLGLAIDGGLKPSPKYDQFWVGAGILLFTATSFMTVALDRSYKATNESSRHKIVFTEFFNDLAGNILLCIKKIMSPGDSTDKTMSNAIVFFTILDPIILSLGAIIIALIKKTKADKRGMTLKEFNNAFKASNLKESYKMRKDMIILSFSVIYGSLAILWGIYIYSYRP